MAAHSETTDRNRVGTTIEEVHDDFCAKFDRISRKLRQTAWMLWGLYVYLLVLLLWFYFEHLS